MIHAIQRALEDKVLTSTGRIFKDASGDFMLGWGTTVGNSLTTKWAVGAIFIHIDASTAQTLIYVNKGTTTTASWTPIVTAGTAGEVTALLGVLTVADGQAVKIGGSGAHAGTAGTNILTIYDGTSPVGALASAASIYVSGNALCCIDGTGATKKLSA